MSIIIGQGGMGRARLPVSKSEMGMKSTRPKDTAKQTPVPHMFLKVFFDLQNPHHPLLYQVLHYKIRTLGFLANVGVNRIKSTIYFTPSVHPYPKNASSIECSPPYPLRILYDARIAPGQTSEIVRIENWRTRKPRKSISSKKQEQKVQAGRGKRIRKRDAAGPIN